MAALPPVRRTCRRRRLTQRNLTRPTGPPPPAPGRRERIPPTSRLPGGPDRKASWLSGLLKGLKLDEIDTGDILLLLILLFLFLDGDGDNIEMAIILGLLLLFSLGGRDKDKEKE